MSIRFLPFLLMIFFQNVTSISVVHFFHLPNYSIPSGYIQSFPRKRRACSFCVPFVLFIFLKCCVGVCRNYSYAQKQSCERNDKINWSRNEHSSDEQQANHKKHPAAEPMCFYPNELACQRPWQTNPKGIVRFDFGQIVSDGYHQNTQRCK